MPARYSKPCATPLLARCPRRTIFPCLPATEHSIDGGSCRMLTSPSQSPRLVLAVAFLGWMFAGQTMSMHQLFVRPVVLHFLSQDSGMTAASPEVFVGRWMAWYT